MNYNGSINEMNMSDFIEHYSAENSNVSILHSAKGTTWSKKNAKYVKRVKINGKWRYYYKEIKESVNKGIKKAKSFFQNIYEKVKNSSLVKKLTKDRKDKIDSIKEKHAEEPLSKLKKKAEYTLKSVEYRKEYKYYQRVRLPNGKWRYFYSQKEYESYLKRNKVLDEDYEFMQDVPTLNIKATPGTAAKHADVGTDLGNCGSCTLAFELLMRGYDVTSSKDIDGMSYDEWGFDSFSGFNQKETTADNWYLDTTKERNKDYYGKGFLGLKKTSEEEQLQMAKTDLEQTIIERGGENQRGFMIIHWTQTDLDENNKRSGAGGGHIFNYVVENGNVKFYDSQKGDNSMTVTAAEIDIAEYLDNTDYLSHYKHSDGGYATYNRFVRVDDKDLKEGVKEYITYVPVEVHDEPEIELKMEKKYG